MLLTICKRKTVRSSTIIRGGFQILPYKEKAVIAIQFDVVMSLWGKGASEPYRWMRWTATQVAGVVEMQRNKYKMETWTLLWFASIFLQALSPDSVPFLRHYRRFERLLPNFDNGTGRS